MRDRSPIVCHGNSLVDCALHAVFHLSLIQGTSAAVDDQAVFTQIYGEFGSTCKRKMKFFSGMLSDPSWKLYGSDIFTLTVVGTAFADKDVITVL